VTDQYPPPYPPPGGPPPGYGYGYPPPNYGPPPDNNMVWAILSTVLCCLPLGVVSIVKSSQVSSLWFQGFHAEAQWDELEHHRDEPVRRFENERRQQRWRRARKDPQGQVALGDPESVEAQFGSGERRQRAAAP